MLTVTPSGSSWKRTFSCSRSWEWAKTLMSFAALAALNKSAVRRTASWSLLYQRSHFKLFTDDLRKPHKNCSNSHLGQRGNTSPLWPSAVLLWLAHMRRCYDWCNHNPSFACEVRFNLQAFFRIHTWTVHLEIYLWDVLMCCPPCVKILGSIKASLERLFLSV